MVIEPVCKETTNIDINLVGTDRTMWRTTPTAHSTQTNSKCCYLGGAATRLLHEKEVYHFLYTGAFINVQYYSEHLVRTGCTPQPENLLLFFYLGFIVI